MDNARGSIFMVVAMAAFAVEDMLIKAAASTIAIGLILMLFGLGGMLVFIFLTWRRGESVLHPAILSRPILLRAVCEVVGRMSFALAITLTALSNASAILQATPLIAMLGAALFFGEQVGLKRWLAVLVGFLGVLMIIRPGLEGFEAASLFAVVSTLGFAGRDLATRAAPLALSNMQLGVYGFFILIPTGLALLLYSGDALYVEPVALGQVVGAIFFGVLAYNALTIAMRTGDVSVVSPFRYTRLLFALLLGIFVFGESPDAITLLGSLLIVLSGGYTLIHSRRIAVAKLNKTIS
ncbi:DMT family transporter [Amphritea sp. 2_MG-2023]|uniref:DMT family transporter n=1 Tax=Amphritea TaxID=515417 RepID=UPI001C064B03|nr:MULTISPECIES: DMT family transporter [Amphritea]MBU2965346.1 DMT family transporter [Amphritea atlantica]MDO6419991.1 DMT family transporter [Amphritea sp. 2_MG-2023]MDX2421804.1 DMT family transporter [Amphritea sp.]